MTGWGQQRRLAGSGRVRYTSYRYARRRSIQIRFSVSGSRKTVLRCGGNARQADRKSHKRYENPRLKSFHRPPSWLLPRDTLSFLAADCTDLTDGRDQRRFITPIR